MFATRVADRSQRESAATAPLAHPERRGNDPVRRATDEHAAGRILFYRAPEPTSLTDAETRLIETDPALYSRLLARLNGPGALVPVERVLGDLDREE